MGEVAAKIKVMPEGTDVNLDELEEEISDKIKDEQLKNIEREAVAFGLEALMLTVVVKDDEGGTDEIEEKLSEIEKVESVKVEDINRLM
ncbi:MAG: Translation elongation factor EF-1 beta [Candidatus Methanohalarchaeum thermophilum]|uniref:Elongation factor 1-beta n=1 Tax=Methanohalarchaeum thermophilum TaxID=1903181 RepID=A0A1Q6DS68_METT1|nr:MAG: Translation elongation factor EF-1 beta [Candidatus Methanohalarchaeum thermophilum]